MSESHLRRLPALATDEDPQAQPRNRSALLCSAACLRDTRLSMS